MLKISMGNIVVLTFVLIFLLNGTIAYGISTNNLIQINNTISFDSIDRDDDINKTKKITFDDVDILIIGRCRSIGAYASDNWDGGFSFGEKRKISVGIWNSSGEVFHIIVQNNSYRREIVVYNKCMVDMNNVNGIFFWGAKNNDVKIIPPILYIRCHAEKANIMFF